ncbi:MAG: PKD domain-containing protein [Metallibacterium sp.]
MQHRLKYALILAALPLLASAAMAPTTAPKTPTTPAPAVLAKLSPQIAHIAATVGTTEGRALQTRALTAQQQPYGPAPLAARFNSSGQVQVYLHYDAQQGAPAPATLQALGATRILTSPELGVVQAWVPSSALYRIAALPQVARVTIPRYAVPARNRAPIGAKPRMGSVDTQGDALLGAAQFRTATGLDGSGISVGIISNGVGTISGSTSSDITQDQGTGDLPTSPAPYVDTAVNGGGSGNEGAAMMEIVYDMAPGAALGFCGPATTVDFITCLNNFAAGNGGFKPTIIADDLGFPGVAMFTDGSFATAVKNFAIANPNIQLLTAAGNDAEQFWSGTWNPITINTTISPSSTSNSNAYTYTQAQNFGTAGNPLPYMSFPVAASDTVTYIVEWDDTWPLNPTSSTPNDPNDYDVFLTDSSGNILACNMGITPSPAPTSSSPPPAPSYCNLGSNYGTLTSPGPQPVQGNQYVNGSTQQTLQLHIYKRNGTPGQNLKVLVFANNHSFQLIPNTPAGSIYGQSALPAPYELTTTAISAADAAANNDSIEPYASEGPIFFSQPSTGTSTRQKPDFTAVDCVDVTGVGGFGQNNNTTPPSATFCGTSATPEATGAVLALLKGAFPGSTLTPSAMLQAGAQALTSSASNGSGNPNGVFGYGMVNAYNSAAAIAPKPAATISAPAANTTTIQPGGTVSFNGSCSANGAPGSMALSWAFGTGASPSTSTSGSVTVTYATAGTYTATLTCTNNAFNTSTTATRTVTAAVPPPPPAAGGGGGGLGLLSLSALAALGARETLRRRRANPSI